MDQKDSLKHGTLSLLRHVGPLRRWPLTAALADAEGLGVANFDRLADEAIWELIEDHKIRQNEEGFFELVDDLDNP